MENNGKLEQAFWTLCLGLGVTAFLAGADKFTNLLTKWKNTWPRKQSADSQSAEGSSWVRWELWKCSWALAFSQHNFQLRCICLAAEYCFESLA
jgi:hypothetical protein